MRCEACDAILLPHEGKWDEELKAHEPLCNRCLSHAFQAAEVDAEVLIDVGIGDYDGC